MTRPINLTALNQRMRYQISRAAEEARERHRAEAELLQQRIAADRAQRDAVITQRVYSRLFESILVEVWDMTRFKAQQILPIHVKPSPNEQGERPLATNWPGDQVKYVSHTKCSP